MSVYVQDLRLGNNWSVFWETVAKITVNGRSLTGLSYCIVFQGEKGSSYARVLQSESHLSLEPDGTTPFPDSD